MIFNSLVYEKYDDFYKRIDLSKEKLSSRLHYWLRKPFVYQL